MTESTTNYSVASKPVQRQSIKAPNKFPLLNVLISAVSYESALNFVLSHARDRNPCTVTALDAHGLAKSTHSQDFARMINSLDMVTPDGHSLKWGLNKIHNTELKDRVAGPDLFLQICSRFADEKLSIYLYGSYPKVVEQLKKQLIAIYPDLKIVGSRPSRFRPSTEEEDHLDMEDIRQSGANLVFVGLGCPLQEQWIYEHTDQLDCPLIAVG